jgi:hypothetical protein
MPICVTFDSNCGFSASLQTALPTRRPAFLVHYRKWKATISTSPDLEALQPSVPTFDNNSDSVYESEVSRQGPSSVPTISTVKVVGKPKATAGLYYQRPPIVFCTRMFAVKRVKKSPRQTSTNRGKFSSSGPPDHFEITAMENFIIINGVTSEGEVN